MQNTIAASHFLSRIKKHAGSGKEIPGGIVDDEERQQDWPLKRQGL